MSTPIATQILAEVGARLALISTANGYNTTVAKVANSQMTPFRAGDLPAINYWPLPDERLGTAGTGWEERRLRFGVEYHDFTYEEVFSTVAAKLAADVQVALWRATTAPTVADNPSARLGDLVTGLYFDRITFATGQGQKPYTAALIECSATYKRRADDPFTISD